MMVESGMAIGLGHGSTTAFAVARVAERLRSGDLREIVAVACSAEVESTARRLGIPMTTLNRQPTIDLTIDGADEVDPKMNLIKGGGGALLREKIVATASHREVIVVDGAKLSRALGTKHPLPVEVLAFGWRNQASYLESLGASVGLRGTENPFLTDHGNYILDCTFGPIAAPDALGRALDSRPGILAHGLFLDLATDLLVADKRGVSHYVIGSDLSEAIAC